VQYNKYNAIHHTKIQTYQNEVKTIANTNTNTTHIISATHTHTPVRTHRF
jgi:hypothetical protein